MFGVRILWVSCGVTDCVMICSAVSIQYWHVTDGQTDRQTPGHSIYRASAVSCHRSDCKYLQPCRERCGYRFLANVNSRSRTFTFAICYRPSMCLSSVVCNARAPYLGGCDWNFRQYFYGIWYLGHPLTSTDNFTVVLFFYPRHTQEKSWKGSAICQTGIFYDS